MRHYRIRRLQRYGTRQLTGRQVAGAVAGGALIALAAHHGSAHHGSAHHGSVHTTDSVAAGAAVSVPGGGTLSCSGLEALWESAGGSPGTAFTAAEIARAESAGQQYATDNNSNGSTDRGYWQVNSIWGALSTYDPAGNARAAIQISGDGTNWSPWVTYNSGAYQGQC
jgi:lysozyme-like protein